MADESHKDEETLRQLYIEEGLTQREVAEHLDVSKGTVQYWLDKFEISEDDKSPWRQANRLSDLYVSEGLSTYEIADRWDTEASVIADWLHRHDIPTRQSRKDSSEEYQNKDVLKRLYADERLSAHEIASLFDTGATTIYYWLDKHGIKIRDSELSKTYRVFREPAPFETNLEGYEIWRTKLAGEVWRVRVHRLLAVAEFGYEKVVEHDVHHKSNIPWDNRPDNLELVTPEEHIRIHKPWGCWE